MTKYLILIKEWFKNLKTETQVTIVLGIVGTVFVPIGIEIWKKPEVEIPVGDDKSIVLEKNNSISNTSKTNSENLNVENKIISKTQNSNISDHSNNSVFSNNEIKINIGAIEKKDKASKIVIGYPELKISGLVLDNNNEAIQDAVVEIPSYGIRNVKTDINGRFMVHKENKTDDKDAEIKVFKEGYRRKTLTVDLTNEHIQVVLIRR